MMQLKRWITGIIALPFLIFFIARGGAYFVVLVGAVCLLSMWEYFRIVSDAKEKVVSVIMFIGVLVGALIILAASVSSFNLISGIIALKEMTKRLKDDHDNAKYLAKKLNQLEGFTVDMDHLDINMVFAISTVDFNALATYLRRYNIIIGGYKSQHIRLVCHNDITIKDIDNLIDKISKFIGKF